MLNYKLTNPGHEHSRINKGHVYEFVIGHRYPPIEHFTRISLQLVGSSALCTK